MYNQSIEISYLDYLQNTNKFKEENRSLLLTYDSKDEFLKYARYFGIMNDFKCGVPRTAYLGVVRIYFNSNTIFIAPSKKRSWTGYDPSY